MYLMHRYRMGGTVLHAMTTQDEDPEPGKGRSSQLRTFSMQFTSSPRGARLARQSAVKRLEVWGHAPESDLSCSVALIVGELTANAVRHGRVPGRDFALRLSQDPEAAGDTVRIEVCDAVAEAPAGRPVVPGPDDESGRGLLLVDILAARWGTSPRCPVGKTVWAEVGSEPEWTSVTRGRQYANGTSDPSRRDPMT